MNNWKIQFDPNKFSDFCMSSYSATKSVAAFYSFNLSRFRRLKTILRSYMLYYPLYDLFLLYLSSVPLLLLPTNWMNDGYLQDSISGVIWAFTESKDIWNELRERDGERERERKLL